MIPAVTNTATVTDTPTLTPIPSITPQPMVGFVFDQWETVELPASIQDGLESPLIVFVNENDRDTVGNALTPQPATNVETLYYVSPSNSANRVSILQLEASTGNQIYISSNGASIAYFQQKSDGTSGLYILDVPIGFSARILPVNSLIQRGFPSEPTWSPDGAQMAMTLATGYDMDIFIVNKDGSAPQNVTHHGSYDLYPAWSPDGRYILFVSDRERCPSWIPDEPEACDPNTSLPPNGGNPYILDVDTGEVTRLSNQWVTEPPRWLNANQVIFSSGDPAFGDPERTLWIASINPVQAREVHVTNGQDSPIRLAESWSPDGSAVLFQSAGNTTEIVLAQNDGALVGRTADLTFTRFGMAASWSPDGSLVAIGGVDGQCPYGIAVLDSNFEFVTRSSPPPSACDPAYSPDGQWLAFTGVSTQRDGRVDIYVAGPNGRGVVNLTGSLRGQIQLLGWVGG
jgi:Tol biopolymer transport system component